VGNMVEATLERRCVADDSEARPTALIVDDHRLFAEAITWPLEDLGMRVVIASNKLDATDAASMHRPSLVLMDIGSSGVNGLEAVEDIKRLVPEARVVALTGVNDQRIVKEALRRGFHGCVAKDARMEQFAVSIKAVMNGELVVPPLPTKRGIGGQSEEERFASSLAAQLTPREQDVLRLLVEGVSSATIARRLSISANTVRSHVQSILPKLQVHSRLELAAFVVRNGLARHFAWPRSPSYEGRGLSRAALTHPSPSR
jgi:two-component system nitrate/nitrite response regulator NarL